MPVPSLLMPPIDALSAPGASGLVSDTLPVGLTYGSSSASQCSCSYDAGTRTLTCNLGTIAPAGTDAYNPAFDVTQKDLITGIVTDEGVLRPPFDREIAEAFARNRERRAHPPAHADLVVDAATAEGTRPADAVPPVAVPPTSAAPGDPV